MDNKKFVICCLALILALAAYSIAQSAQETAEINNVFSIVVNNTDLYPSQRTNHTLYWANESPIAVYVVFHALGTGASQTFDSNLTINGSVVLDKDYRTSAGAGFHDHWSFYTIVPKGANYSVQNSSNVYQIEWREYPILSGKNGTLSVNQTFFVNQTLFNATYDATTIAFNSNYSAQTFPNSTISYNNASIINLQNNDTNTAYLNTVNSFTQNQNYGTAVNTEYLWTGSGGKGLRFYTVNLTLRPFGSAMNFNVSGVGFVVQKLNSGAQANALCYNSATGEFTYNSGVTTCLASSEKYKTNIAYINQYANSTLKLLKPVKYTEIGTNTKHVGFIAEDINNDIPQYAQYLVVYEPGNASDPRALNYEGILTLAVKTIQEQQAMIDKICSRNQTLCQ